MKRLLLLLVVLAGGVVVAALAVPTNAADVDGTSISQQSLNSDVSAIAASPDYQCYLNSQEYLSSQGEEEIPPVTGAGTGQNPGDNPTATSAFVATYLDTDIGHVVVEQLADQRGVVVTSSQLSDARKDYEAQITEVMTEVAQSEGGDNAAFTCGATEKPLTGSEILTTLPKSFVDQQVQFVATATVLQEDLSGYGSSQAELERFYESHQSAFDTACLSYAVFSTESDATTAQASVGAGTPFATVAATSESQAQQGCYVSAALASELGADAGLDTLALNTVSKPISYDNGYLLFEITKRTPTAFSTVKSLVADAVEQAGGTKMQKSVDAAQKRSDISVNPQYGKWVAVPGSVLTPLTPAVSDVPNAKANESTTLLTTSKSAVSG